MITSYVLLGDMDAIRWLGLKPIIRRPRAGSRRPAGRAWQLRRRNRLRRQR